MADPTPTIGNCSSCRARVFWGINVKTGKRSPIDADAVQGGNVRIVDYQGDVPELAFGKRGSGPYVSHFSTCPDGPGRRRSR